MPGRMRRLGWSVMALAIGLAAPAQASCWSEADMDAAKVRDLQSRLMVATLRCNAAGVDVTHAYNRFVVANRETLQGINGVLMTQFAPVLATTRRKSITTATQTALANAYGGDATDGRSAPIRPGLPRRRPAPRAAWRGWWPCTAGWACRRHGPAPPARERRSVRRVRLARVEPLPCAGRWSSPARSTGWCSTTEPEPAYKDIFIFAFGGLRRYVAGQRPPRL